MKMSDLSQRHQYGISMVLVDVLSTLPSVIPLKTVNGHCFELEQESLLYTLQAQFVACAARYCFDEEQEDYADIWMEIVQFFSDLQPQRWATVAFILDFPEIDCNFVMIESQGAPR